MDSYNYSYNVLINRLEAFAAGHFLIRRFTHGQIDLSDTLQDDQYPFMHVTPDTIEPISGGMQFGFHIMFADIPRDKEYKAEYQREVISDCIRLGQDLIAEVQNGLELFGFNVQLVDKPVFEPFMEEQKNTVTGIAFTIKLEVPWDWSACDIPAIWSVGGAGGSGGSGVGYGVLLRTNSVDNAVQNILNLVDGTGINITDNGNGSVTIDSSGGGGGEFVSTEYNANHTTALGNQYLVGDRVWYNGNVYRAIANNDALLPTNTAYWTLVAVGYRLRQTPVDWNAVSGDNQILNKPTIPTELNDLSDVQYSSPQQDDVLLFDAPSNEWQNAQLGAVAYSNDYNDLSNLPSVGSGTVTSVALTTPAAFTVTGSPITTTGTLAITGAGIAAQYIDGTGALQTSATALPPNGAAGGDLQGSYPTPTVHRIHNYDMQSGLPVNGDTWVVVPTPFGTQPVEWRHQKLNVTQLGDTTTVGQNIATLANPSAVRYLRINADNTASAISLATLKSELGMGSAVVSTDQTTLSGGTYTNVTALNFAMTSGKTYKWRATIWVTTTTTANFSTNGPAGTTIYRFTMGSGATTNLVNNGTANNTGTVVGVGNNRIVSADGIYVATATGTFNVSMISLSAGGVVVKAGSILEYEEVL
jgi:hypothetical protein